MTEKELLAERIATTREDCGFGHLEHGRYRARGVQGESYRGESG